MGFAAVASTAVLLVAAFHLAGTELPDVMTANEQLDAAERDAFERQRALQSTSFAIASVSHDGSNAIVDVLNDGDQTLDAQAVLLVINGNPRSPDAWTIDGRSSSVWAPGETARFVSASDVPTHIVVVTESGAMAFGGI